MTTETQILDDLQKASRLFQCLAHVPRLKVLLRLARSGPLSAGELLEGSGLNQSAFSHQLRALREAHLVSSTRKGRQVLYDLEDAHVLQIVQDALAHVQEEHEP